MKVVLDSYDLLRAIGAHREAFAAIDQLVRKQATALLTAQLKHKALDLQRYRVICGATGGETFELFLDAADDKLLKAIAKKIDPYSPLTKAGDADELRAHLLHLAHVRIEPVAKVIRSATAVSTAAAKRPAAKTVSGGSSTHAITTKPPGRR